MQAELEALFGRRVDLLTREGIMHAGNARLRRAILRSAERYTVLGRMTTIRDDIARLPVVLDPLERQSASDADS